MIPDEPVSRPPSEQPADTSPAADRAESPSGVRLTIMVLAVVFAVAGLASLVAILATAFLQGTIWPGFVLATYFCLPIAFILMMSLVILSVRSRRRS